MQKTNYILAALFLIISVNLPVLASTSFDASEPLTATILSENSAGFSVKLNFTDPNLRAMDDDQAGSRLWLDMPGCVIDFDAEGPALPVFTRLVAVPDGHSIRARVLSHTETVIDAEPVVPKDQMRRTLRAVSDKPVVEVGDPGWMRSLRVAPVVFHPARYDDDEHQLYSTDQMVVEFDFIPDGQPGKDAPDPERYGSLAFDELFRVMLLNPGDRPHIIPGGKVIKRGSYLIITDEDLADAAAEFAEWKRKKGFDAIVAPIYHDGISANEIRDYIQEAYDEWERPPEFVLLVGDVNMPGIRLPAFRIENPGHAGENDVTDLPYVLLEGDDYFPDAFIGRISSDSPSPTDARKVFYRVMDYEQGSGFIDRDNYHRATLFAGNFGDGNNRVLSPVETNRWLGERLREKGYEVEEFYYRGGDDDNSSGPIVRSISRGVNIVSYRGWADASGTHYPEFYKANLDELTNNQSLPVFTFFVCNTGDYGNEHQNPCFGEYSITRGTLLRPRGALAFYGPSDLHTSTRYNNPMLAGYYTGLLYQNIQTIGVLTLRAKLEVWAGFPHQRGQGVENNFVEFYFHAYNILGDPELNVCFNAPGDFQVTHPEQLSIGDTHIEFQVADQNGRPFHGALINLHKPDETELSILTDHTGLALVPVELASAGELEVTVIGFQKTPYQAVIPVVQAERMIGFESISVSNEYGDNRFVTGSPVEVTVRLRNTGTVNLQGVQAGLSSPLELVTTTDNMVDFGDIAAGDLAQGASPFTVEVNPQMVNGESIPFVLDIHDANGGQYSALFRVELSSSAFLFIDYEFTQGELQPGGADNLVVGLLNYGSLDLSGVHAEMHTFDEAVVIEDVEATFGDMAANSSAYCSDDPFRIAAMEDVVNGRSVALRITVYDSQNRALGRVFFNINIGERRVTDPVGPDGYGYYAYDNTDHERYAARPVFDWVELDPEYDGEGAEHHPLADDSTFTMDLPFTFTYYGMEFDAVSICSNGWFSFEDTWMWNFRNWSIPSPLGPHALVAPYWEDLVAQVEGDRRGMLDIYTRYDAPDRFIIQWSRVVARTSVDDITETFQAILYNPQEVQTPTGDGEILFQYLDLELVDRNEGNYATVGFEDWNHFRGLGLTFAGEYTTGVEPLAPGRAILITTVPPEPYQGEQTLPRLQPVEFALDEPYPNPFNSRTWINFSMPNSGRAQVTLWDLNGRLIRLLAEDQYQAGEHSLALNAGDLPSGIYLVRLEAADMIAQRKVLLLR